MRKSWDAEDQNGDTPPIIPTRIVADPRKFTEYVLVPDHPRGKDRIFIGRLGYRPRNEDDARTLVETYVSQARDRIAGRRYALADGDEFGQRVTIEVELRGMVVLSGWILQPDGTLWLATPFAGFARA